MKILLRRFGAAMAALAVIFGAATAFATPTISITSPASGSTIANISSPGGFTITANATPTANASIVSVQFFDNGVSIGTVGGTSPFSIAWVPSSAGSHTLTATVTDNSVPTTGTSPSVNTATATSIVTVTTVRTITLATSATTSSVAQDSEIFLRANAVLSDTVIGRVEYYVDSTLVATRTQAPYNVAVDLSAANGFAVGSRTLTATVFNSDNSISAASAPVTLNIAAPVAGDRPPTVTLAAPANNSVLQVSSNITLTASASDEAPGFIPSSAGGGVIFFADGDPITPVGSGETNPDLVAPYSITWRPTVTKTFSLRAQTVDDKNNVVLSSPVSVSVVGTLPTPTATITTPSNGATVAVNSVVSVNAAASASGGATVSRVDFFNGAAAIGSATASPYTISWTPTATGTASLTARVTDSNGTTATSGAVNVTVATAVSQPTIALTAPTAGRIVSVGAPVSLAANASATGGATVSAVEFLVGSTVVFSTSTPASGNSYTGTWTPTATGSVSISARVTDSNGTQATTSPAVGITVAAAPTVVITAPSANAALSTGSSVTLSANATAGTGLTVSNVQFLANGVPVGSATAAPYTVTWTPSSAGATSLTARVTDSAGATITSNAVAVNVSGGPTVTLTAPAADSTAFVGANVTVAATATTAGGITVSRIDFLADGVVIGTDISAPFSITWVPTAVGGVSLTARATDSTGAQGTSSPVSFLVADPSSPTLTLAISPSTSTTMPEGSSRYVIANAVAGPGRAIASVEFFVDGASVAVRQSAPYSYRFTAPASSGTSTLLVRATDNGGLVAERSVTFTMVSAVGEKPVVSMIGPAANTTVLPGTQVNLVATANDSDGSIASVQFYSRGEPVGALDTTSPYQVAFNPATPGTYVLEAIATDDKGNTTVSNPITLTAAFATPTVAITSPSTATTARATPNVPFTVQASALGGGGAGVLLVEFLLDGVPMGTVSAPTTSGGSTYLFRFTPTTAQLGPHVITARVTDNNSQTATSTPLNINIANAVGTAPTISITQPAAGAGVGQAGNLQSLSTVNFVANAASTTTGVTISNVEFFLNDVSIGTGTREQATNLYRLAYDFSRFDFSTLTPDGNGRFLVPLYAIARDSNNNQTATNPLMLTVNPSTSSPPSIQVQNVSGTTTITQGQQFLAGVISNDSDGAVSQIQLFANGAVVATANNPAQGQLLTYNANTAGRFNLYAVATDDTGNTSVSSPPIVLNVTAVSAPVTTLTRPTDDSTATTVGAPVFLEGTATNSDSTQVPTLQFVATAANGSRTLITGVRVGTTTTYRQIWTPTAPGTYTISTQATVGTAQGTSSNTRRVVVTNIVGLAPTVTIAGGVPTTATTASQSNFTANATDSDGSVVEVEFFLNRNSIGFAKRDELANTWRLTAAFAGLQLGSNEVVALARDSSGNVAASPTSTINVTAASSIAPSITIEPSTTNAAFNRQVQLRANVRDTDGTVNSVQYFANGTSLGTSTNATTNYQVNWTPNQSGTFNVWAVATDNTGITTVAPTVSVTVRRNNPILEDAAFILQTYQDIANTTNINPLVFDSLDAQLGAGALSRADVVTSLVDEPGFVPPVNLLAAYYVLMGQWPTPANYNSLIGTARTNFPNAIGAILSSNEYFAKYGVVPTVALLNNPASAIPADTFIARLWEGAGLGAPSALANLQFRSNNTLTPTLGRGYGPIGLNQAIAEFITNTNSTNTALMNRARAAALYYQLLRPQVTVSVDQITQRVNALAQLPDVKAMADSLVRDVLYRYRYVTITKHPTSLTVSPRSGALFNVQADGAPPLAYQWLLNGAPIPGATNALLSLTNVDATRVGTYTAVVTSSAGTAMSDPATLTLSTTPTRLANISTRGVTGGGANVLIGGFVVSGANANQTRQMLVRVIGPRLSQAPFNVSGVLADPRLEIYTAQNPNTPIFTNDNWGTQAGGAAQVTAIQQATNRSGAFALQANSADAVVLATLPPGLYTVQAKGPANTPNATGVVLIEVYDASPGAGAGQKATNVSTRGMVGTGSNVMIAGFVVNGAVSRRMLIRGAGPTLASLGVPGVLADPEITLVHQATGETIRANDNWHSGDDAAIIAATAASAGAFAFGNGSRDAAMLLMLAPGAYTVQLSGVGGTSGVGIVEVYDVDP